MFRKNIIIVTVIVAAVLAAAGYVYWQSKKSASRPAAGIAAPSTSSVQSAVDAADAITKSAAQGTLPSVGSAINPLESKPDLNPADKANPFKSIKTNPFQ